VVALALAALALGRLAAPVRGPASTLDLPLVVLARHYALSRAAAPSCEALGT
jgi:hypothetical protein